MSLFCYVIIIDQAQCFFCLFIVTSKMMHTTRLAVHWNKSFGRRRETDVWKVLSSLCDEDDDDERRISEALIPLQ